MTTAKSPLLKKTKNWSGLDAALDKLLQPGPTQVPGLGVIILENGMEIYHHYAGWAVLPGSQLAPSQQPPASSPLTNGVGFSAATRLRAASVSKQFTVFTLMQLVEAGKLRLDDDVSTYLGFTLRNPAFPNQPITIKMLTNHTSSLQDGMVYSIPPQDSLQEVFTPQGKYWEKGAHLDNEHSPGSYFSYCNLNYGLLGTIIEAVTGQRFDIYQENHILQQLDIKGKYLPGSFSNEQLGQLGVIYQKCNCMGQWKENGPWYSTMDDYSQGREMPDTVSLQNPYATDMNGNYSLKDYQPGRNATPFSPQGGLRLSCQELSHATIMLDNHGRYKGEQILQPESVQQILTPSWLYDRQLNNGDTYGGTIPSYGLGVMQLSGTSTAHISRNPGVHVVGHTGEAFGLLSASFLITGTPYSFVYMANGEAIAEDDDPRSAGSFSSNYIWEEVIMDAICSALFQG